MVLEGEVFGGDELSADDKAYFESGGKVKSAPVEEPAQQQVEEPVIEEPVQEPAQEDTSKPVKTVPHQALHAEREEHKQTKAEVAALREQLARHEQRMNALLQQMQPQQPEQQQQVEEDPMPPADDPIAKLEWLERQFIKQQQQTVEQQKVSQEQQAIQRHVMEVDYSLNQAIAADPTVKEAFDFGVEAIRKHYASQGVPPWDMEQYVRRDMQNYALKAPKDPAALVEYVKANARYFGWGYQPPQAQQPQPSAAAERIDRLQAGVTQNKSLSQAGGKALNLTAADIDSMSDDEFSEWLSKGGENAWRKANGV